MTLKNPNVQQAERGSDHTAALATLDQAARDDVSAQRPDNTIRSYGSDWRAWQRYCEEYEITVDMATVGTLVGFVRWMHQQGLAVSTAERRLSGVRSHLRHDFGLELTTADAEVVRAELNNYRRGLAEAGEKRGRGQAPALTVRQIRSICAELPESLAGHRDRALLLIGFGIGARRSELANLLVGDVELSSEGLAVAVRWSKTGENPDPIPIGYGTHRGTCPVRAWKTWLKAAGLSEGAAFRRIDRHGNIGDDRAGMTARSVGDALTRAGKRAGVAITGHSLRAGMATEARRAGHDAVTIARQGRWSENSRSLYGYMRTVDRWGDNALVGIGL